MEYILDKFFESNTMSVHFKENVHILRKRWKPGNWISEILDEKPSKTFLQNLINQFYKEVEQDTSSFLEIDRNFSKVLQLGPYRVVVVLPPLSDGIEITAVKPVKKLSLKDYNLNKEIIELFKNKAKGILISGSPWEWKTTFAQALVEFYVNEKKIVKTIESPRDLLVPDEVTQYSFSYAPHSEIRDILLLARPDFTIYDEVRNIDDFILFKDLRLAGIWLIWVIHATNPIDSIQRFLGTIEMGVIPQVIDTIIFIKSGKPEIILNLKQVVKVPAGMHSEDLARPVIQVINFDTKQVEYEIYTYGEQVVVMDLKQLPKSDDKVVPLFKYAEKYLQDSISYTSWCNVVVKAKSDDTIDLYVPSKLKGKIIGKWWENITDLETKLWLKINVKEISSLDEQNFEKIKFDIIKKGKRKYVVIDLGKENANKDINIKIGQMIFNFTTDKIWQVRIKNKEIIDLIEKWEEIYLFS